jgi:hypothetical protein
MPALTPAEPALKGRFWLCQACGKHVPARLTECRCGFSRKGVPGLALEPAAGAPSTTGPAWFAVGPAKLVVMAIGTLGLYQVYWFYQQWRRVRDGGEDVRPLLRSLFGVLFCYPLFKRIVDSTRDVASAPAGPAALAVAYILLSVSWKLPSPFNLLTLLSVLPLAAVQRLASAAAERDFPRDDPNRRLTGGNWVAVVVGVAFLGLIGYAAVRTPSQEFLAKVAEEANRRPQSPSNGVRLDRTVAQPGTLVYYYTVNEEARAALEQRKALLKDLMVRSVCADRLLKMGASVRFVYSDAGGQPLATVEVSPRDCR